MIIYIGYQATESSTTPVGAYGLAGPRCDAYGFFATEVLPFHIRSTLLMCWYVSSRPPNKTLCLTPALQYLSILYLVLCVCLSALRCAQP